MASLKSLSTPIIDIHTHVAFPEVQALARKVKVRGSGPGKQNWIPPASRKAHSRQASSMGRKLIDEKARLKDMDRMGVDIQVVSMNLPTPAYWADGATGQKIARTCNETMAEFIQNGGERFIGMGAVPLQDISRSVRELDYLVNHLGLRGVAIPTNVRTLDLGAPKFRKFWAKAEELRAPFYIHPRGFTHDERLQDYFLWNSVGQPLEEALAMASLIHEGVMEEFPNLKIIMAHGGGYLPYYAGRGDKAFEVRPEPRTHIKRKPSDYFRRFHYDTVIFDRDMLPLLIKKAGAGRIMMGTDYPRGEVETNPVGFVKGTRGLSNDAKRKIMSRNAMRLFGL